MDGNRISMDDVAGTTAYEYDEVGRITAVNLSNGKKILYSYDEYGNISKLNTETDRIDSLQTFIGKVKKITQPTELTPELVHEFIEKIVVSAPTKINRKRYQQVDIYYNGVGVIKQPTAEEWE